MLLLCGCGEVMEQLGGLIPEELLQEPATEPYVPDPDVIPHRRDRVLLKQLEDELYANACMIYECAMNFEEECVFPYPMDADDLSQIFTLVRYECPELLQLDYTQSITYTTQDDQVVRMTLPLGMSKREYNQALEACQEIIAGLVEESYGMTDKEMERLVYEYITDNCTYTTETQRAGSAYGCLVEGKAKCDGISYATKWILEEMGLRCFILSGEPVSGPVGHAWNVVEIDGEYMDLDVTADVNREDEDHTKLYAAYNVDSSWIRDLYIIDEAYTRNMNLPGVDTMEYSFYALEGCYMERRQEPELESLFLAAYEDNGTIALQFERDSDFADFCETLGDQIDTIARDNQLPGYRWQSLTADEYRTILITVGENS